MGVQLTATRAELEDCREMLRELESASAREVLLHSRAIAQLQTQLEEANEGRILERRMGMEAQQRRVEQAETEAAERERALLVAAQAKEGAAREERGALVAALDEVADCLSAVRLSASPLRRPSNAAPHHKASASAAHASGEPPRRLSAVAGAANMSKRPSSATVLATEKKEVRFVVTPADASASAPAGAGGSPARQQRRLAIADRMGDGTQRLAAATYLGGSSAAVPADHPIERARALVGGLRERLLGPRRTSNAQDVSEYARQAIAQRKALDTAQVRADPLAVCARAKAPRRSLRRPALRSRPYSSAMRSAVHGRRRHRRKLRGSCRWRLSCSHTAHRRSTQRGSWQAHRRR